MRLAIKLESTEQVFNDANGLGIKCVTFGADNEILLIF